MKNLSVLNISLLNELKGSKRFHLIKALCLTVEIAFSMKRWEYMLAGKKAAWYWKGHGLYFSSLHHLIPALDTLQKHIAEIEHEQGFTGRVICLEGESERSFLERLHLATRLVSFDNNYFVYGGKDVQQNLVHYIRDNNDKGVCVDLAYDGDSNLSSQFTKLQRQVNIRRVFRFERDFEAAFPPEVLAAAITEYFKQHNIDSAGVSVDDVKAVLADPKPFVKVVEEKYGMSIAKPILSRCLAVELLKLYERDDRVLHGAGLITGTELSRFLRFVIDWPEEVSPEENASIGEVTFPVDEAE